MKPSTPKGTRDFLPPVVQRRNYIFGTIKSVFEKYGYQPIETPAMENLETLTGKYGEEGDRLIFKILARGEKLTKALSSDNASGLADGALRYDLTVPFARFVVQHRNDIEFPFRRYQIQPVWRADRPQKGRYREFFQCDADVVGTDSLRCEIEFVEIFDAVFTQLDIPVTIRINNRKILAALADLVGEADRMMALTIAIDKLDKMPLDKVLEDLKNQGFSDQACATLENVLTTAKEDVPWAERSNALKDIFANSAEGLKGIEELDFIFERVEKAGLDTAKLQFDLSLARGLNYYTGAIFEVVPNTEHQVGSICGGGRYDDLTGIFGMPGVSGVGISFGADRIYDLLEALDGFDKTSAASTQVLFVNFGDTEADYCHELVSALRKNGVKAELYPDSAKMKKQMKYADDKRIPFVAMVGEDEMAEGLVKLKDMATGEQEQLSKDALLQKF